MNSFCDQTLSTLTKANLSLPALEVLLLLSVLAFCLVLRTTKTGLIIAYLFTYRWGWIILVDTNTSSLTGYLIFGMAVGLLTVVGMVRSQRHD